MERKRKIVYIDMDNTLADYLKAAEEQNLNPKEAKHVKGFFRNLKPMPGAIEAYNILAKDFDVYFLTTSPWSNPQACVEKFEWVKEYFPNAYKNIIISHHKDLNIGDYLIDDSTFNGAGEFTGEHIQIWTEKFPNWKAVIRYIFAKERMNLYLNSFTFLKNI
jgi:5'(3')-deoxyribonucleotidase